MTGSAAANDVGALVGTLSHRDLLLRYGWLSRIDPVIAGRILDLAAWRDVPEGTVVYQAGTSSGELFGVATGQIMLWHREGSTDAQFVHNFRIGQWFGYAPILAGERRRHQCIARTPCSLAVLPEQRLRAFLAEDPEHWHALASLVDMQGQVSELAGLDLLRRDPYQRLCATMLRFAGCRITDGPDGPPFEIACTQMELAEASNMSRNSASRILAQMEADGLVEPHYRHLSVLNAARIRAQLVD